jgi:beta-glucosidase/6-phospho-beta-glucosidase/beta-galactosidase
MPSYVIYYCIDETIHNYLSPGGRFGHVNPDGVTFYNALINALLDKGMNSRISKHMFL